MTGRVIKAGADQIVTLLVTDLSQIPDMLLMVGEVIAVSKSIGLVLSGQSSLIDKILSVLYALLSLLDI